MFMTALVSVGGVDQASGTLIALSGTQVRGTQSTRAILQEQDLEGFDEAVDDPLEAAAIHALDGINELGLPAGYDYEQHMRPMGQAGAGARASNRAWRRLCAAVG